jgi:hypothetical protein
MNWEMLAAIGQLAAVCIGIPSLIYLATQIRHQTKERQQAAVHALTEQFGDLTRSLHDNPEMADVFLRGLHSFKDLTSIEKMRFSAFFNRFMNVFEGMYFSHREGILIGSSWGAVDRIIEDIVANPGLKEWWETRRRWHTVEFARVLDDMIARAGSPTAFAHYAVGQSEGSSEV